MLLCRWGFFLTLSAFAHGWQRSLVASVMPPTQIQGFYYPNMSQVLISVVFMAPQTRARSCLADVVFAYKFHLQRHT